jgi:hypothetical protein
MADLLLRHGQLAPVEVDVSAWPEGWEDVTPPESALARWSEHLDRPLLVFGYRRHAAALLLAERGETSPAWQGLLRVAVAPAGLSEADLEDRNLTENLGAQAVAYVDMGLAAHRLVADPRDGGRGEDKTVAARKLRVDAAELERLLVLPRLCEEARVLSRLNHRDPERGLTRLQAYKLARRPLEEQQRILREARDAAGVVVPKAARAVIAPLSGRQGQPPGATGAQLDRLRTRLSRLAESPEDLARHGVEAKEAALCAALCAALKCLDPVALKALPGRLGRLVEAEFNRSGSPER